MAALTKSEMAEKLFEELGFNKREAKELVEQFFEEIRFVSRIMSRSSCRVSAILICATNASGPVATPRRERRFPSQPAGW